MRTYIVLFRGINVGGKNLVPMKELASVLEKANYQNIKTYIQSGNVVLQSEQKPDNIASLVMERFGFETEVMILEETEFNAAVSNNPFESAKGKAIHFYFCRDEPDINTDKLEKYKSPSEEYHISGKIFFLFAPEGIGRSKLVANLESCLGVPVTGRNLNTIRKLKEMV